MAKKTKDTNQDMSNAMNDAMSQLQKMGMESMTWMGGDWMQKMNELGSEVLHFMAERMQKDLEFQQKLMQCRNARELQEVQAEFIQTAIDRYTDETGKLIDMGTRAMTPTPPKSGTLAPERQDPAGTGGVVRTRPGVTSAEAARSS